VTNVTDTVAGILPRGISQPRAVPTVGADDALLVVTGTSSRGPQSIDAGRQYNYLSNETGHG
jgi:hypothetical protein